MTPPYFLEIIDVWKNNNYSKILISQKCFILVSEGAVLVKELKPDTEYAFYLNGYNDVGQGAQAKLLDKTLISPPLGLIVQADPDYPDIVQLNWAFNANITKYRYVHPKSGIFSLYPFLEFLRNHQKALLEQVI